MTAQDTIAKKIGVIADDLTGAMDTGVQFARGGLSARVQIKNTPSTSDEVVIISTESRQLDLPTAQAQAVMAARLLKGRHIFKKIDSTLRGYVAAEILAILKELEMEKAVICPAVIEEGRKVQDGFLWVDGLLLHETDFAFDPHWPAITSDIKEIFKVPAQHVPIDLVRANGDELANRFRRSNETLLIPDALKESDIGKIGSATVASGALPCGALGLAKAWLSAVMGPQRKPLRKTKIQARGSRLIISGSRHPQTMTQIQNLARARELKLFELPKTGRQDSAQLLDQLLQEAKRSRGLVLCTSSHLLTVPEQRQKMQSSLGALTKELCEAALIGGLIICGGDTARTVVDALATEAIEIEGMLQTGFPYGMIVGGVGAGLPIVTKAGGFGSSRSLVHTFDALNAS